MNVRLFLPLLATSVLLSACGTVSGPQSGGMKGGNTQSSAPPPATPTPGKDGPPNWSVDIASIQDAVPRSEPRSKYGNPAVYSVLGKSYRVQASGNGHVERGLASWYGTKFHGRRTSSGEPYDLYGMTAAHKTLPLPTYVEVTNIKNGRKIIVKVNDRGPFHEDRIIDLSYAAAQKLGINSTAMVEIRAIDPDAPPSVQVAGNSETATETAPATPTQMYLQVGAFTNRGNAEQLRARLQETAAGNIKISESKNKGSTIYRVRIGPLASAEDADQMAARLGGAGVRNSQVVID
ncbi:MAG: septal ring lytic transglycosylase RlpA family protein [Pseudomonadota bacterium]